MRFWLVPFLLSSFCFESGDAFAPLIGSVTVTVPRTRACLSAPLSIFPLPLGEGSFESQNSNRISSRKSSTAPSCLNRRGFFSVTVAASLSSILLTPTAPALAKGLVQFPLTKPLFNSYTFMRVGTTLLEEEDIWSTNPLFLTNRDDALSAAGQAQVQQACREVWLSDNNAAMMQRPPTIIIHSLAAAGMDTANIIQQSLQLGRDRIRPEFTFLDPRAIGKWDLLTRSTTQPAVWALDHDASILDASGGRPPPNEDGTPNETLADQAVRLRQLLSVLESQYSGESIVLVFPDGTGPALLASLMAGINTADAHRLEFAPGEIRTNVTPDSVRAWYQARIQDDAANAAYQQTLQQGRIMLEELQSRTSESITNRRDEKLQAELVAYEEAQKKKEVAQAAAQAAAEQKRQTRAVALQQPPRSIGRSDDSTLTKSPFIFAAGVALATVGLTQLYRQDEIDSESAETVKEPSVEVLAVVNGTTTVQPTNPLAKVRAVVGSAPATESIAEDSASTAVAPGRRTSSLYGTTSAVGGVNGDLTTERKTAAVVAMQEYLDQDDGGDAWISSLAEIIEEEAEADSDHDE